MKVSCSISGEDVVYRLSDYDPVYETAFQMCFYDRDSEGFFKRFPLSYPYTAQVMKCFSEKAHLMFDQLLYRVPVPWESALELFCYRVRGSELSWWLTGSCAACIRGIDMNPHDVDIMIDSRHCRLVEELFAEEIIEPLRDTSGWVTRDFGVLFLTARVDIASDPSPSLDIPYPVDCGQYALSHLEEVVWRGYTIKVPPVELHLEANRRRSRTERVNKILAYMDQQCR